MPLSKEELDELDALLTLYRKGKMDAADLKDNAHLIMLALAELIKLREKI